MSAVLVVGGTGNLGRAVVRLLVSAGHSVRVLVRRGRQELLSGVDVEILEGDLRDRASLDVACSGMDTVVTTASATGARLAGDSIPSVDREGNLALVDAAESAHVKRFVFVSFAEAAVDFELQRSKRAVEERLARTSFDRGYAVLRPTYFMETWLAGFAPSLTGPINVLGSGEKALSWVSIDDVAEVVAEVCGSSAGPLVELRGPEKISPLAVIERFKQVSDAGRDVVHVPEVALQAQYDAASDPLQQAFAALMLDIAKGSPSAVVADARLGKTTVADFVATQTTG